MQAGAAAMRSGQPAEAERDFRQALAADPHSADAFMGLGMSLLRENKPAEARDALQQAIAADPSVRGARMFIGIVDYQRGDFDNALVSLKAEADLQPNNPEVLTWIGIVELAAGHPVQATIPLDQAAALEPKNLNILYYQGRAHTLVAQGAYQKLFELGPDSWQMHRAMGEIESQSREPEKALAEFEAAARLQPNDPDLYQNIGDENQRLSHFDDATKAYERVLQIHPNDAAALCSLGKIQVQTGDTTKGLALLQQALAAHGPVAPVSFYMGEGLARLGRNAEAAQWLERSLASDPSPFLRRSAWFELARVYRRLDRPADAQRALAEMKKLDAASPASLSPANHPEP
ncbi:MAG TPA: tetratricopeptide repeat protein [Acidobacteriaceae bacterium]|jgi:tetratricopeptide (TPR) repeat protein|nr:tetratricopeptide repeat protein [Acidobacteriaceae bacterium]